MTEPFHWTVTGKGPDAIHRLSQAKGTTVVSVWPDKNRHGYSIYATSTTNGEDGYIAEIETKKARAAAVKLAKRVGVVPADAQISEAP